jgi:hypothetical protein
VVDDRVHGDARGDFAGVVAAQAVGDHAQPEGGIDGEAILVAGSDPALVGETERTEHDY